MARALKITCLDDKDYVFSTLTLRQQRAFRKKIVGTDGSKYRKILNKVRKGDDLDDKEQDLYDKFQDEKEQEMLEIIRMSIAKKHEEFRPDDENTVEKINEKLEDIIDGDIFSKVTSFAMSGTIPRNIEETFDIKDVIDLTDKG